MKKDSMKKIKKVIDKELDNNEAIILSTMKGIYVNGNGGDLGILLCMITSTLAEEGMPKDMLKECYELSFMDTDDLLKEIQKRISDLIEKKENKKDEPSDTNR